MIESIVIAIILSIILGKSPSVIYTHIEILIPVILIVAAILLGVLAVATKHKDIMVNYRGCFALVLYALFLIPIGINYRSLNIFSIVSLIVFMFIGRKLNQIVIKANYNKMPVYITLSSLFYGEKVNELSDKPGYVRGNRDTRYKVLADWIDLGYEIYSPGDVISFVPFGILFFNLIAFLS